MEQIKNVFLAPKTMRNKFLSSNPEKQKNILNILLWNAKIENKKIANINYKQPYDVLSKIDNKSDFNSIRGEWDVVGTFLFRNTNIKTGDKINNPQT